MCQSTVHNMSDSVAVKDILSFGATEKMIMKYTGMESIKNDMCPKSCMAYTGPYIDLEECPLCGMSWWNQGHLDAGHGQVKVGVCKVITIPIGPQLQAWFYNTQSANEIRYLYQCTKEVLSELCHSGKIPVIGDVVMGHNYLNAYLAKDIQPSDIVLSISMDSAQLYEKNNPTVESMCGSSSILPPTSAI